MLQQSSSVSIREPGNYLHNGDIILSSVWDNYSQNIIIMDKGKYTTQTQIQLLPFFSVQCEKIKIKIKNNK